MSTFAAYERLVAEIAQARDEAMTAMLARVTLHVEWERGMGYIYAIRFTTGIVKVGRTFNAPQRFKQHEKYAAKNGFAIDRVWRSKWHPGYTKTEMKLKAHAGALGSPVPGKGEQYADLDEEMYEAICFYGSLIVGDAVRFDYLNRCSAAVDGDESKSVGEAHAAAAAKDPAFAWIYGREFPVRAA